MKMMVSESFDLFVLIVGLWVIANLVHVIFNVGKVGGSGGFFCLSEWLRKSKEESNKNGKK